MKKEIVSKSFGLIIKEAFLFLVIRAVSLASDFFATIVNQAAGSMEIERLKGETSLAFSEFVINHQGSFTAIFGFAIFLLALIMVFILFKDGNKILKLLKERKE